MLQALPFWRSMLFVPVNVPRFVARAHQRGADALILDLEDSLPVGQKLEGRAQLAAAVEALSAQGAQLVVRVNSSLRLVAADLEAAVLPGVRAICLPKVSGAAQLRWVADAISELEDERGLEEGAVGLIALIESAEALASLPEIARATPRLWAITLGSEDFSAEQGMVPNGETLLFPSQQIVFAARAAGITPLGFIGSIAEYGDLDAFRDTIRRSRHLGLRGGFCIHPDQVRVMNEEFAPSIEDLAEARAVIAAYEDALAEGRGTARYQGKMIDKPVVARAREVLAAAPGE